MDFCEEKINEAYKGKRKDGSPAAPHAADICWYLWCGPVSPLYGKNKMATFESYFIAEKEARKEITNPYYRFIEKKETAERILRDFGIDENKGHIICGHVPVKAGEHALKAEGKVFLIDGGIAKAYHEKTGIAGYTLIFNSHHLSIASHEPYEEGKEKSPHLETVEYMNPRIRVDDTDLGKELRQQASDLEELLVAYQTGLVKEKPKKK